MITAQRSLREVSVSCHANGLRLSGTRLQITMVESKLFCSFGANVTGIKFYSGWHQLHPMMQVAFARGPENIYDKNSIVVLTYDTKTEQGHLERLTAAGLAPLLDWHHQFWASCGLGPAECIPPSAMSGTLHPFQGLLNQWFRQTPLALLSCLRLYLHFSSKGITIPHLQPQALNWLSHRGTTPTSLSRVHSSTSEQQNRHTFRTTSLPTCN